VLLALELVVDAVDCLEETEKGSGRKASTVINLGEHSLYENSYMI
jgi:hypothetical protein